jgi:hypothetical protein
MDAGCWPAQGIAAEIPQTPQPLAILYLLLCRDPPVSGPAGSQPRWEPAGLRMGWVEELERKARSPAFGRGCAQNSEMIINAVIPGTRPA